MLLKYTMNIFVQHMFENWGRNVKHFSNICWTFFAYMSSIFLINLEYFINTHDVFFQIHVKHFLWNLNTFCTFFKHMMNPFLKLHFWTFFRIPAQHFLNGMGILNLCEQTLLLHEHFWNAWQAFLLISRLFYYKEIK